MRSQRRILLVNALLFLAFPFIAGAFGYQPAETRDSLPELFQDRSIMQARLRAPLRRVRTETNDSVSLPSYLAYSNSSGQWDSVPADLKARGHFRLDECFYPPMKLEFAAGDLNPNSPFYKMDKLKLVIPCQKGYQSDDYVLKEYLAYRMFELISPYHLKTRLMQMTLYDQKDKKAEAHELLGFMLEHNKEMAARYGGRIYEQKVHPMQVDTISAIRNSFFQFMIGNTDFSLRHNHNRNILFLEGEFVVVPYDFDMSGFVNTNYSTVSNADNLKIIPTKVTERSYKGYQRELELLEMVRQEFLLQENALEKMLLEHESYFRSKKQFEEATSYIDGFYRILKNEQEFEKYFIRLARNP